MKKSILSILLILIVFALGCGGEKTSNKGKIGILLPTYGELKPFSDEIKAGIDVVMKTSSMIEWEYFEYNAADALEKTFNTAFEKGYKLLVGGIISDEGLVLGDLAKKNNIIIVSPIATSTGLFKYGKNLLKMAPSNKGIAQVMVDYIDTYSLKNIAFLYINNEYGVDLYMWFNNFYMQPKYEGEFRENILLSEKFEVGQTDFSALADKMKEKKVESVILTAYVKEAVALFNTAKQKEFKPLWLGSDGIVSNEVAKNIGNTDSEVFALFPLAFLENENKQIFDANIEKGFEHSTFAAYGYDSAGLLKELIVTYATDDISTIFDLLETYIYEGITGPKKFDDYGVGGHGYDLWKIENGAWVLKGKLSQ